MIVSATQELWQVGLDDMATAYGTGESAGLPIVYAGGSASSLMDAIAAVLSRTDGTDCSSCLVVFERGMRWGFRGWCRVCLVERGFHCRIRRLRMRASVDVLHASRDVRT
jgi:hypothetical protein